MSERNKKYLIVFLLFGTCLASAFLLLQSTEFRSKTLTNLAEADSLLNNSFRTFNISENQVREDFVEVDSVNKRKLYRVRVPDGFSKTQLHYEIHNTFKDYSVDSPTRVIFPDKDFHIHLLNNQTVFATVKLQTDPDLVLQRSFGSILVAFESEPPESILEQIKAMGEPISIVMMMEDTKRASDIFEMQEGLFSDILLWLKNENGENIPGSNTSLGWQKLQSLQEYIPNADVLSFQKLDESDNTTLMQNLSGTTLNYIDVSEASLLQDDMGRAAFKQELQKFSRQAQRGEYPIAIVMGDGRSVEWLRQELAGLKKRGLRIIPPKKKRF
ncbi:hypothetical protein G3570_10725 [Balneolaceae bacterium YR4-1]|uniref:Uncharacterized protein n=1 Tax=Halalkalibaculum roseum TaxID=2709311 RepID=A0A6M1SPT0_9BACT|nr:hypothetical protein [Halalkalibaculum roseum]NGP77109.1 hypothetical protein [Halalkalibaculum roseum]